MTSTQTLRLNAVAYPPNPCTGTISFADADGNTLASMPVTLDAGEAAFLDVTESATRTEVRPVVTVTNGACVASAELFSNKTEATSVYFPPNPCAQSSASCLGF